MCVCVSNRSIAYKTHNSQVRWRQCGHVNLLSSSTETKEDGTIVKTLTKEIASHVASDAKLRVQVRMLRDEIATHKIAIQELRDVVTRLQQEDDKSVDIERELWCRVVESNFREIATRKQLRDASCVEIELREKIATLQNLDDEESFTSSSSPQQDLLNAYLEVNRELVKSNCELNLEKKKCREHLKRMNQDNERDMRAVLRWLQQSKLEAKEKSQREEKILDRVKRAEQVADTVPKRIVAAEHRIRKLLERDRSDLKRVREKLEITVKKLGQEQSRCKEMEIQYESAKTALDEMKRVVDIAEKRFRKMKNRVASFKTSQQQYETEMKKRDKIEKQMQARIQGLTSELETERGKNEDALLEEMQRVDDEIRRRDEEWKAQSETQREEQQEILRRTRRDLEDARQRCEIAEKKCTKVSFAIAELATLACRIENVEDSNDGKDEFEYNLCRTWIFRTHSHFTFTYTHTRNRYTSSTRDVYKDAISTSTTQSTTCEQYGTITETREASDRNRDESEETTQRDDKKIRHSERG